MVYGMHVSRCLKCGIQFTCGDCIDSECPECRNQKFAPPDSETVYSEMVLKAVRGVIIQETDLPDRSAKPRPGGAILSKSTISRVKAWTHVYKVHDGKNPGDAAWRRVASERVLDILQEEQS